MCCNKLPALMQPVYEQPLRQSRQDSLATQSLQPSYSQGTRGAGSCDIASVAMHPPWNIENLH